MLPEMKFFIYIFNFADHTHEWKLYFYILIGGVIPGDLMEWGIKGPPPPKNFGEKEAKIGYPRVFSRAAHHFFGKSFDKSKNTTRAKYTIKSKNQIIWICAPAISTSYLF